MHLGNSYYAIIGLCLFFLVQVSTAQERDFGLGVIVGEPTGISAKLWTSSTNALDIGFGWSVRGVRIGQYNSISDGGILIHFHMDYLWHVFDVIHSAERVQLYYGAGGRLNNGGGGNNALAIRSVFGAVWFPSETPIEVFLELVPTLQFKPSTGFGLESGIGARYYF
jgi:hypothetical protein